MIDAILPGLFSNSTGSAWLLDVVCGGSRKIKDRKKNLWAKKMIDGRIVMNEVGLGEDAKEFEVKKVGKKCSTR